MDFQIVLPGKTIAGKGALSRAGLEKYGKKPLIVTGKHTAKSQAAAELLKNAPGGVVFDGITGEPTVEMINAGVAAYHENSCDHVIGIGGGSALDSAKAIAAMSALGGNIADYMGKEIDGEFPSMVLIPTTAGTGSEATKFTIITDTEKDIKMLLKGDKLLPDLAVLDYSYTLSAPKSVTAATGMDALTHAIEGYTTKGAWELSDMFHFEAIKLISENLRDSVAEAKSGQPGSGREGMALGQYVAGMGFSNVGLGIDHAMAHTLSAHYDTPHGVACAMLLPIAMEFNKPVCAERLAKVAVAMGVDTTGMSTDEAADAAIAAVKQLSADVNIPHVCEAMKADEIEVLAKDAMADACFPGNPREATLDDVIELFKKICPAA